MNQANDCGPCARIVSRIDSTSGVFNCRTSNAQRSTSNASISNIRLALPLGNCTLSVGRLAPTFATESFACLRPTSTYLRPPPGYRFRRPWYFSPWFYIPVAVLAVVALFVTVFFSSVVFDLQAQANGFDLNKMDQMESASVILDRNGKIFGQIYVENRETIPYDQIPRNLVNAAVAVEDARFYQHHGYVLQGILRATLKNLTAGHVRQGASTITQQLARNSFALKGKTYRRKLLEIFVARRLEDSFNKQKILELYLNLIYFGGGLYGAEAAARGYFGKRARDLSLSECATLAGLIKSPNRLSPWSDKAASRDS